MTTGWLATIVSRCRGLAQAAEAATDGQLLARFVHEKDETAFDLLLARHAGMVWAVCRANLPNDADSEDAFQATFVALATHAKSVKNGDSLGGWLHGTALRIAGKAKRSHVRRTARERMAGRPDVQPPAVADSSWGEWQAAFHEEVRSLPASSREAFVACVLEGQRHQDVANRLGVAVGTIAARVSRARQTILDRLTVRGLAPAVAATALTYGGSAPASVPFFLLDTIRTHLTVGPVPATIHALARFAGEGVTMKTKLLAATVMIGVAFTGGTVARNRAEAQAPPVATAPARAADPPLRSDSTFTPPAASPTRSSGINPLSLDANAPGASKPNSPRWIYSLVDKPKTVEEFGRVLMTQSANSFEYIGSESFGEQTKMVFKMWVNPIYSTKPASTTPSPSNLRSRYDQDSAFPNDTNLRQPLPSANLILPTPASAPEPNSRPSLTTTLDQNLPSPNRPQQEMLTPETARSIPPVSNSTIFDDVQPVPVASPKPAFPFSRGNTITSTNVPAVSPSPLRDLYEMEVNESATLKIPDWAQAEKVMKAVQSYIQLQSKEPGSRYTGYDRNLSMSFKGNDLMITAPKPVMTRVKLLISELLRDLKSGKSPSTPANPTTR